MGKKRGEKRSLAYQEKKKHYGQDASSRETISGKKMISIGKLR